MRLTRSPFAWRITQLGPEPELRELLGSLGCGLNEEPVGPVEGARSMSPRAWMAVGPGTRVK